MRKENGALEVLDFSTLNSTFKIYCIIQYLKKTGAAFDMYSLITYLTPSSFEV